MKNITIMLITIIIIVIVVTMISLTYYLYKIEYRNIARENEEFEQYKDKEIYGIELATLINRAIDKNTKNKIEKDSNNQFITNEENSIEIEIYMEDSEQTYRMEMFYNTGIEQFIQYYGDVKFKCSKVELHEKTKRIKYLLFEQKVTS